jgi:signal transduction histidine kinase
VTSAPLKAWEARQMLSAAVRDVDALERAGQLEIIDHEDWYLKTGRTDAATTLQGWIESEGRAVAAGYDGLRLTGNTAWLEQHDWQEFSDYEQQVSGTFAGRRVVGLCSYCLDRVHAQGVLDVVRHHQFAVTRRHGAWEMIEAAALKLAKEDLRQLNGALELRVQQRTEELERALKTRDDFLSVASHEMRTPLAALLMHVDGLLRKEAAGDLGRQDLVKRLRSLEKQARRMESLVNTLLDVSQPSDGGIAIAPGERFDLVEVAQEVCERMRPELTRVGSTVTVHADGPAFGEWDRMRIEQVFGNLLANTVKYAPGTLVDVTVGLRGNTAAFAVRDRGPGIAAADRERIFERFARAARPDQPSGFGLGLWIVHQIVTGHGGRVTATEPAGGGACFEVELPALPA